MGQAVLHAALFTLIPVSAAALGGLVASLRTPDRIMTSLVQHGAAGVVFAAVAVELIPEMRKEVFGVGIGGFGLGIAAMFCLNIITRHFEERTASNRAGAGGLNGNLGLVIATGVDILIDGLVLGAGFSANSRTGILLTVALTLELVLMGLAVAVTLRKSHVNPIGSVVIVVGLALLSTAGAVGGLVALNHASSTILAAMLAFGAVALLYVVAEDLLKEALRCATCLSRPRFSF